MPGSHGSLTKAGKVKMQTPKIERTGVNSKKKKASKNAIPGIIYRKNCKRSIWGSKRESWSEKSSI